MAVFQKAQNIDIEKCKQTHTHTRTHTCMLTHSHNYTRTRVHTYKCSHARTPTCTHAHTHTDRHTVNSHTTMYMHKHRCTACMAIYQNTCTQTSIHAHTWACLHYSTMEYIWRRHIHTLTRPHTNMHIRKHILSHPHNKSQQCSAGKNCRLGNQCSILLSISILLRKKERLYVIEWPRADCSGDLSL